MPYLSPPTLTTDEQKLILRVTAKHPRDHVIISMALGTGLRLGELVGLNVGDVYAPDGRRCSATNPAAGSRSAGSSSCGGRGSNARGSIACTRCIR